MTDLKRQRNYLLKMLTNTAFSEIFTVEMFSTDSADIYCASTTCQVVWGTGGSDLMTLLTFSE